MALGDIYTTPLADQPIECWPNAILWRLGVAAGVIERGAGTVTMEPDMLLEFLEHELKKLNPEVDDEAVSE